MERGTNRVKTEYGKQFKKTRTKTISAFLLLSILTGMMGSARAQGLITGSYSLNWDQNVDKTGAQKTDVRTFRHSVDLKFRGFLSPIVQNEITLKIEQERESDADPQTTTRIFPTITLSHKGSFWNAGAKRTIEESNEPDTNRKISDSFFIEYFYDPPRETLPDLKGKYTLDEDFESGVTDTRKQDFTISSEYRPMNWIEFEGDYSRALTDDNLQADADTEEDQISGIVGIRHFVSKKIRLNTEFRVEISKGATLLDAGGKTNQNEDQAYTWKNTVAFRPFRTTNIDGSFDFDFKNNIANGEHTFTKNWKAAVTQRVSIFDLKGDFTRVITEARHTADDNEKTEDTWTVDARVKFSKHLDFYAKYQTKHTDEVHFADPSRDTTSEDVVRSATWSGELTPFWKASASYDRTEILEKEVTTTIETKYSFKTTLDFKAINLVFDPTYDITQKEDRQQTPTEETETKDFKFKFAWKAFSTNSMEAKIEHTYGRKTDSGGNNIERTDNSTGGLIWKNPFPGWNFGFDVTRSATDKSEDDQPPDITSTFGFKADYIYKMLAMSISYKYDKKSSTDDSETFDLKFGWKAPRWDATLTYSFDKTFSEELNEGYSISLSFQYNL
jgi:predicted porin